MRTLLFDIDGTLALTAEADGPCFADAYQAVFHHAPESVVWEDYAHVTDWGILDESLGNTRGRSSTRAERAAFEDAYRAAWEVAQNANPAACEEVPGAAALVAEIVANPQTRCGVATGGTRAAAQFKLSAVGIDPNHLPGAYANDSISRSSILLNALRVLGARPADVVYVGDGGWDVQTCRTLGMPFIGIAAETSADMLQSAGANAVMANFADRDAFWSAVECAVPPSPSTV